MSVEPQLFWKFVIGNSLIALSLFSVVIVVLFLSAKRKDIHLSGRVLLFSAFLIAVGATHLFRVGTMLHADNWLEGDVDAVTGALSALSAIALWTLVPKILAVPPFEQMLAAHGSIDKQNERRETAERKSQALLEASPDAIVMVNQDGQIKSINSEAARLFGYTSGELIDKNAESLIAPRFRIGHPMNKMGLFGHEPGQQLGVEDELLAIRKDGRVFAVSMILSLLQAEEGTLVTSVIRDITQKRQFERNLSLQHKVGEALEKSQTLKDMTGNLLRITGEEMGWAVGSFWTIDQTSNVLRCAEFWSLPKHYGTSFAQQTKRVTFAPGAGLPGRVWVQNEALWIEDVRKDTNFARASAAIETGLCSGIAIPVSYGNKVFGVCDFFSEGIQAVDDEMQRTLSTFGRQIGQFMARQQMQSALMDAEERLRIFVSAVSEYAMVMLDAKGRIVTWNDAAKRIFGYDAAEVTGKAFDLFFPIEQKGFSKLQVVLDRAKDVGQFKEVGTSARKDGSNFNAEITFTALKDERGQVRGFGTVTHDITPQVRDGSSRL